MITSSHNPLIRSLRGLHLRKHREEAGRFLIEGLRLVETALAAGAPVEQVLHAPALGTDARGAALLERARAHGVRLQVVTDAVMAALSDLEAPQPVAAVVRRVDPSPESVLSAGARLLVVDRAQDPGNLGTMIRVADAAGASAVVTLPGTVDLYNPKTVRATMGSLFHLPVAQVESGEAFREVLRARGVRIIAADPAGDTVYTRADYAPPVAIVVGQEAHGIDARWRAAADVTVRIPLLGRAESLNAAVAAALLLYEAARPRFEV